MTCRQWGQSKNWKQLAPGTVSPAMGPDGGQGVARPLEAPWVWQQRNRICWHAGASETARVVWLVLRSMRRLEFCFRPLSSSTWGSSVVSPPPPQKKHALEGQQRLTLHIIGPQFKPWHLLWPPSTT